MKYWCVNTKFFDSGREMCIRDRIAAASEAGVAASTWSVGDTKNITVGGETLTVEIVGFNHDDLASGGKAGITFGLKNLMANTRQMNSSNTNAGGFTGSDMYDWLQGTLLNSLPSDLRAVLKSVDVYKRQDYGRGREKRHALVRRRNQRAV